ncbi:hypothetical protein GCM10010193_63970 [Kitasatospora atroaurantiaca]
MLTDGHARIGVKAIGVDEHIWGPSRICSADKAVTVTVDLTRSPDRRLCARLFDALQGRPGTGEAGSKVAPPDQFTALAVGSWR